MNQYIDTASPTASQHRPVARFHGHAAVHALLVFTIAVGLMAIPSASQAAPTALTWYVAPTGNDGSDCLSPGTACLTIQAALFKAAAGDTISVAAGVYVENLQILKNVTLQGADQATTIVDGNAIGSVLTIAEDVTASLSGVTLQNGHLILGAGLKVGARSNVNISNSRITGNAGTGGDNGAILNQGNLKLTNVTVSNNVNIGGLYNVGSAELIGGVVSNNQSGGNGGGIYNKGVLTITGSTLSGNQAGSSGGAIYNVNALILNTALISQNRAASSGGGIYNAASGALLPSSLIDSGSIITGNQAATRGGGIYNDSAAQLNLMNTNILSNTAKDSGGGLFNLGGATLTNLTVKINAGINGGGLYNTGSGSNLTLNNSTVMDNQADSSGGGLYNDGPASLSGVSLINNRALTTNGGGIFNSSNAQLIATGSTLSQNYSGQSGGGINNRGTLTLTQSAVYSNTAVSQGSGLYNNANTDLINVTLSYNTGLSAMFNEVGTLNITNATISDNAAPNLKLQAGVGSSMILANTIVAGSGANCDGVITSAGHNLDSANTCGFTAAGDLPNTNPQLGPLQNNGGATSTRDIAIGSPAVDGGDNATCPSVDQRGIARPQGNSCDIGAYEVVGYPANDTPLTIPANGCVTSTLTIASNDGIGRLQLGVNLNLEPRGNLRVNLYAPFSSIVHALSNPGGSGNDLDVLWDDVSTAGLVGTASQDPASPYFDYVRQPDNPLAVLSSHKVNGTWKLEVCNPALITGTLNHWVMVVPNVQTGTKIYLPVIRNKK